MAAVAASEEEQARARHPREAEAAEVVAEVVLRAELLFLQRLRRAQRLRQEFQRHREHLEPAGLPQTPQLRLEEVALVEVADAATPFPLRLHPTPGPSSRATTLRSLS